MDSTSDPVELGIHDMLNERLVSCYLALLQEDKDDFHVCKKRFKATPEDRGHTVLKLTLEGF